MIIVYPGLNEYFVNVGSNLAAKIPHSEKHFSDYLQQSDNILRNEELTIEEFETAFKTLKKNKACGFDEINSNVIKSSYNELLVPLFHICKISLKTGCFPEKLKIAKITPLFKSGETDLLNNYRPISILPVFSKILEKIMYNRVYKHVSDNLLLYEKQFGFQKACSPEYAILQLTKEIYESFDKQQFTLGIFVDLSKAFDTVNHTILLSKLTSFGIQGIYIDWFKSYLHNRKQYISYDDKKSKIKIITCGVPQGSILGPLLFLLYVNDLQQASKIIKPIMFADDTNLFYSNKDLKLLFKTVNTELERIQIWFNANKLSLNVSKTKYSLFHSSVYKDKIPLHLPKLTINDVAIKREPTMTFLGVLLDENLNWKEHINYIENKISKSMGILYKSRFLLNEQCTKNLYFDFVHSYLNYGNAAWASTTKTNLSILLRRQKHASRIVYFKDRYTHAKPLMISLNALNIYQLNIYKILLFMHKVKNNNITHVFKQSFSEVSNKYNTKSSSINFYKPLCKTKCAQYAISYRGPYLWNSLVPRSLQTIPFITFKQKIKTMCLKIDNEVTYF